MAGADRLASRVSGALCSAGVLEVSGIFGPRLAALLLLALSFGFLVTAPQPWHVARSVGIPRAKTNVGDRFRASQIHEPRRGLAACPLGVLVPLRVMIRFAKIARLAHTFTSAAPFEGNRGVA